MGKVHRIYTIIFVHVSVQKVNRMHWLQTYLRDNAGYRE